MNRAKDALEQLCITGEELQAVERPERLKDLRRIIATCENASRTARAIARQGKHQYERMNAIGTRYSQIVKDDPELEAYVLSCQEQRTTALLVTAGADEINTLIRSTKRGAIKHYLGKVARETALVAGLTLAALYAGTQLKEQKDENVTSRVPSTIESAITFENRPEQRYKQLPDINDTPLEARLREELGDTRFKIGEPFIAIDPLDQQERVYALRPVEVMVNEVSTGKNVGPKQYRGDGKTPENKTGKPFEIIQLQDSSDWLFEGKKAYGPWFGRIEGQIGLHGCATEELPKIGKPASHGCIRHRNETIAEMYDKGYLALGNKVLIKSGLFDDKQQNWLYASRGRR